MARFIAPASSAASPLPPVQLESAFVRVAERGNFADAAQDLALTPVALRRMMDRLQRQQGARLLFRQERQVCLTWAGQQLYQRLQGHPLTPSRPLVMAVSEPLLSGFLQRGLLQLMRQQPQLQLVLQAVPLGAAAAQSDLAVLLSDSAPADDARHMGQVEFSPHVARRQLRHSPWLAELDSAAVGQLVGVQPESMAQCPTLAGWHQWLSRYAQGWVQVPASEHARAQLQGGRAVALLPTFTPQLAPELVAVRWRGESLPHLRVWLHSDAAAPSAPLQWLHNAVGGLLQERATWLGTRVQ
ncbi:helix-turn-helix domain-containing protein [Isoalcanivorax beigongshangi]|uniref:LysR family transcriptional regulator n=1 Tax=Isoalcanivorax beigongshangi TaxID=3238810 RepID=A0ABV4ACW1_9GAMM